MSVFIERLGTLEELLAYRRSKTEGGWPNKLHIGGAATTIVATAQVLEFLRIRGAEHSDPMIQGGLRYLAEAIQMHAKSGSRNQYTRFPAYALWGMMRYPAALEDSELLRSALLSYEWLMRAGRPKGGWGHTRRHHQEQWLSLPVTMVAVHALERFSLYASRERRDGARTMVEVARNEIARVAKGSAAQRSWAQAPGEDVCPGATSLAVLTLARGSAKHRACASGGIAWLAANPERWTNSVHIDEHLESRTWRIFSFSLGLRALLHPCAPRPVTDPTVAAVVEHFDALWNQSDGGWSHRVKGEASMAGSYAVISAAHALKRAWPFDPARELGLPPPRPAGRTRRLRPPRILYVCEPERTIRVTSEQGETLVEATIGGGTQWTILHALAKRHHEAASKGSKDQTEHTLSLKALAKLCNNQVASVQRSIRRLNAKLGAEARKQSRLHFVDLIEDHVPPGTSEKWAALEEIEVRFVSRLPPEKTQPAT